MDPPHTSRHPPATAAASRCMLLTGALPAAPVAALVWWVLRLCFSTSGGEVSRHGGAGHVPARAAAASSIRQLSRSPYPCQAAAAAAAPSIWVPELCFSTTSTTSAVNEPNCLSADSALQCFGIIHHSALEDCSGVMACREQQSSLALQQHNRKLLTATRHRAPRGRRQWAVHLPAASACALHRSHANTLFELHNSGPGAYGLNFAGARPVQAATMAEGGDTNFRELLQRIETALCDAAEVDAASFLQTLQRAKPSFLNLFRYKASAWDASGGRLSPFGAVGPAVLLV